jgi:hypothetical protein
MEIYEYPRTSLKRFHNISSCPQAVLFSVLLPEAFQSYTPRRRATVSLRQIPGNNPSLISSLSSTPPVAQIVFYQAGVGTESHGSEALLDG